jgi:protein SCO1
MQSGSSRTKLTIHPLLFGPVLPALVAVLLLLHPGRLQAHSEESLVEPFPNLATPHQEEAIGLDEHLGARIPLDVILRDESGQPVRLGELVPVPTIILPVYYSCTNICVSLQAKMAGALQNLERHPVEDYRVISVSIDENETPEMASRSKKMYLAAMPSPFPAAGWRFLTGDAANIHRLTDALGFNFQRQGRDFLHPVASIVIAPDGTIVRYLYGTTILPKDLALALVEAKNGVAGVSIRKLMEYCFTFDPTAKTYVFNLLRVSASVVIICTGAFLAYLFLSGKKRTQPPARKP